MQAIQLGLDLRTVVRTKSIIRSGKDVQVLALITVGSNLMITKELIFSSRQGILIALRWYSHGSIKIICCHLRGVVCIGCVSSLSLT